MSQGFDDRGKPGFGPYGPAGFDEVGPAKAEPRRHGCFFYGCIVSLVLLVIAVVSVVLVSRYILGEFRRYVEEYTEPTPRPLPVVAIPEEQRQAIVARVDAFVKRVKGPSVTDGPRTLTDEERTLVLTADELNAYLERSPEVRGKFHVEIVDGRLRAQVSLPLGDFPGLRGRYLNGESGVEVSVVGGRPVVQLRDVRVKGRPLPEGFRQNVEAANWADEGNEVDGSKAREPLEHELESIEIKDGTLIVVARKEPTPKATTPAKPPEEPKPSDPPESPD